MLKAIGFTLALVFSLPTSAPAAIVIYTNSAAFAGAVSSQRTVTFDDLGNAFYGGPGFGGVGTVTDGGVTVSTTTSYLFSVSAGGYGSGTVLSAQQFAPTSVQISFAAPVTAAGFNYGADTPLTINVAGSTAMASASPYPTLGSSA